MNIVVIIQARTGSTRLPGKILKPLGTSDVLSYVTKRCHQILGVSKVIVATSTLPQDDAVVNWCEMNDVLVCRGSEEDVLARYVECAEKYQPNYVMRVTADCPFVDYELASELVSFINKNHVDIVDLKGEMPRGLAVEIISFEALKRIDKIGQEPRHREHVTYYAYEYPDEFSRIQFDVPKSRLYPEFRITLDTEEDYKVMQEIANYFDNPLISSAEVIQFLQNNPHVAKLNAHIEQKPVI